jgi:hypothetical protein
MPVLVSGRGRKIVSEGLSASSWPTALGVPPGHSNSAFGSAGDDWAKTVAPRVKPNTNILSEIAETIT